MRFRLSQKFLAAILVYSLLIVVLMAGSVQFFAQKNFADYVLRVELGKLDDLVNTLEMRYLQEDGWEFVRDNPRAWNEIIREQFPNQRPRPSARRPPRPDDQNRFAPRPDGRDGFAPRPDDRDRFAPPPPGRRPPPEEIPNKITPRLSLFDKDKALVFGNSHIQEQGLRAVLHNGEILGWVGLKKPENLSHPLDQDFLKQQAKVFYIIAAGTLALGGVVSLFLSRLLVGPIRSLTKGVKQLSSLQFETQIEVKTKDELGELAETFNTMVRTLQGYERARRQWLTDTAHELRTPLSILQVEIESMLDGVKKVNRQALDSLHAETLRLGRIVQDLHELSVAESKTLRMNKAKISVIHTLRETMGLYSTRLAQDNISLIDELGEQDDAMVLADQDRLIQVFSNLMENALRYTAKPGTLIISSCIRDSHLVLHFQDSGPGVPREALPHLFERFYRVDRSRSREHGGSGLGLAICKIIVEAHGGGIIATKASPGGLRVEITLPLA